MSDSRRSTWLARLSLTLVAAAVVLLLVGAGTDTFALFLITVAGAAGVVAGGWLGLAHRGAARAAGVALVLASLAVVVIWHLRHDLLWVVVASALLLAAAFSVGRGAMAAATAARRPVTRPRAPSADHPYLILNPRSGGGAAERFGLRKKAEDLGVEVFVIDGPGFIDVADVARRAIDNGADLIGVAGGDGTQALVAAVAADNDVPMFVVPAGTRNHFALDLGIDRTDLGASLDALTDGVDVRVDLGDVDGRPFVNNVSFGAYAAIVERPDYRENKLRVSADALPDLLSDSAQTRLTATADGQEIDSPQVLLVSNNSYGTGFVGAGRRDRLDEGVMGVVALQVAGERDALHLLGGARSRNVVRLTATEIIVDAADEQIAAGVDGESVMFPTPVHCRVRPGALRVRVSRAVAAGANAPTPVHVEDLLRLAGLGRPNGHPKHA